MYIRYMFQRYSFSSSLSFLLPLWPQVCSLSASPLLPCRQVHQYHFSLIRSHLFIFVFSWTWFFFFFGLIWSALASTRPLGPKSEKAKGKHNEASCHLSPYLSRIPENSNTAWVPALWRPSWRLPSAESHPGDTAHLCLHALPTSPGSSMRPLNTSSFLPLCWFCS